MDSAEHKLETLPANAELFHLIVENVKDFAVFMTDAERTVTSWNSGVEKLFGYAEEEIVGQPSVILFTPEDVAAGVPLKQAKQAERTNRSEDKHWYRRKNGSRFWAKGTIIALNDAGGAVRGFIHILRDDTARKQAEENLNEFLSSIADSFYRFDRDLRYTYVNRATTEMFGFTEEEFLGKKIWDLFPEAEETDFHREVERALETQEKIVFESYYEPFDRWFENRIYPAPDGLSVFTTEITGRKRADAILRDSEEKYRTLFDSIDEGFCVIEILFDEHGKAADYRFLEINPAFEKLTGVSAVKALQGITVRELIPNLEEKWFEIYGRVALTGEATRFIEGSEAMNSWFDVYAFSIGEPEKHRVALVFNNITERKKAEIILREAEQRYRALIEATATTVWHASSEGALTFVGDIWTNISGQKTEEILKWGWLEMLHPDDREHTVEVWQTSLKNKVFYSTEFRILTVSGEYRWFAAKAVPVLEADGSVREWIGINSDVDLQKRLDLRNRFIIELDEAARPIETPEEIARTLARLLGKYLDADRCAYAEVEVDEDRFYIPGDYTRADTPSIVGHYNMEDFGAESLRLMRANRTYVVNDVNADPQVAETDLAAYRATDIQAVICVPLHKNNRFSAFMAVHQKTPRRWLADEIELVTFVANRFGEAIERARILKSLQESLSREQESRRLAEQANRLKDEFLATLSHELRTPLNAILGWSQMLQNHQLSEAEKGKALATIERNAKSQSQLIDDILDVSRIITGKLRLDVRAVDLSGVIAAAIDAARPAAEAKDIRLQVLLDPQAGPISGDPDRLQQIVWNLLSNAVKFTPKKGRIQVRLERVESHVEIVVSDTGKGIEAEFLPHVFDRFRQSDGSMTRRHGGLGLGLAIVRQIVELHGGTVSVLSGGEGQGTTFTVNLPLLPVRKESSNDIQRVHPAAEINAEGTLITGDSKELIGLRVLLVDDEADSREMLNLVLTSEGASVTTADSAAEAFRLIQNESFDIFISDIGMPDEDGFTLIRRIRKLSDEKGGKTPAIALTAYARREDRIQALRSGFQIHIAKPVESYELIAAAANIARRN